ncbi:MAG: PorV/PorQ family protein [Chitinophagaceae bacterium]
MKYTKRLLLLLFAIIAQNKGNTQFRKYSNEFLNIGAGARGLAMGSAQIASVQDGTAGYWNPAGLVYVTNQPQLNVMHAEYFSGIAKYDYASLAFPSKDQKRTLGISLLRFAVDDIPNTLYLVEPDGSINYNNITTFSSADYAFLLSYAQKIKDEPDFTISVGGNAKIIHRNVGSFAKAWGFGLDAGIQIHNGKWRLAAVIRDATTTFNAWKYTFTEREKEVLYLTNNDVPVKSTENTAPRLIVAAGYLFKVSQKFSLLAEANVHLTFDGKRNTLISSSAMSADPNIGLEASINKSLFLRAGISNFQRALSDGDTTNQKKVWIYQPSLGAGFKIGNASIDYAFTNLANQDNPLYTHIFSLKIDLVKKVK